MSLLITLSVQQLSARRSCLFLFPQPILLSPTSAVFRIADRRRVSRRRYLLFIYTLLSSTDNVSFHPVLPSHLIIFLLWGE
jgi:hypothetical protein